MSSPQHIQCADPSNDGKGDGETKVNKISFQSLDQETLKYHQGASKKLCEQEESAIFQPINKHVLFKKRKRFIIQLFHENNPKNALKYIAWKPLTVV